MKELFKKIDTRIHTFARKNIPGPLPQAQKVEIFKTYARQFSTPILIETGTYLGDTIHALQNDFQSLISIELSDELYAKACKRFENNPHITILHGNSETVLPSVLKTLDKPALFWLDGHYSAGVTAKGDLDSPILAELAYIFEHPIKDHIILIDDARHFVGENGYPTVQTLLSFIQKHNPHAHVSIAGDIIRITPPTDNSPLSIMDTYSEPWREKTYRWYRMLKKSIKR